MTPARRNYSQNWLPNIFNELMNDDWLVKTSGAEPAVNVTEKEDAFNIEIAVPGACKEDFQIHLEENCQLVISMEKKTENKDDNKKYLRHDFSYTSFKQTFILPDDIQKDKINANVTDGILNIELPKLTPEQKEQSHQIIEIK